MNSNQKAQQLLNNLREAIDDALAESPTVLAAMGELEDAGFCPSFAVNVALPEERDEPSIELVTADQGLILTVSDDSFLRALGIAGDA